MSCDTCGKNICCPSFHPMSEQIKYEKVIEAFDHARMLRDQINQEGDEDE